MRIVLLLLVLSACTREQVQTGMMIPRMLFGYLPPPEQTTALQEMTKEYDMCMAIKADPKTCTQDAYDTVRLVKGMDRKPLPEGIVIVREEGGQVVKQIKTQ